MMSCAGYVMAGCVAAVVVSQLIVSQGPPVDHLDHVIDVQYTGHYRAV